MAIQMDGTIRAHLEEWTRLQARALRQGALECDLLLQLDSIDEAGMMWGDVGRLYFMIPRDTLAKSDFGATWLIMQCC